MKKLTLGLISFFLIFSSSLTFAAAFDDAMTAYEKHDYLKAISLLESVVKQQPEDASAFHLLGKAYGRQAELSPWYKAINLAKKTRENFERAVELDPNNVSALRDLRNFYKKAPPFLGGGEKKAESIAKRLEALGESVDEEDV